MVTMISATEYETTQGHKTFKITLMDGYCHVTSWATKQPTARCFWGCRTFRTVSEVAAHYKAWRGIDVLLAA